MPFRRAYRAFDAILSTSELAIARGRKVRRKGGSQFHGTKNMVDQVIPNQNGPRLVDVARLLLGAPPRTRTWNHLIKSQMLYH